MSTIGCDPSVVAPAFATWPQAETWQLRTEGTEAQRLLDLYARVEGWARDNAPPDLDAVFIERPVGRIPSPEMVRAAGVIEVALLHGLSGAYEFTPSCFRLSPPEWKRWIGLGGAAKKGEVASWAVLKVAGPDDAARVALSQDKCDALGIAAAGYRMLEEEGHVQAA